MHSEEPIYFLSGSNHLLGIIHQCERSLDTGVIILVGGPQYRVGSHRQFVLLARKLADSSISTMRFDFHGMGDSEGDIDTPEPCEVVENDIHAAINTFLDRAPTIKKVVLWGLCDGATAGLLYAYKDARVVGLALINPWISTEDIGAKTYFKYYYLPRLFSWKNLKYYFVKFTNLRNTLRLAMSAILSILQSSKGHRPTDRNRLENIGIPQKMQTGWEKFSGEYLLVLSGKDMIAAEFKEQTNRSKKWKKLINSSTVTRQDFRSADHTFSTRDQQDELASLTIQWIKQLNSKK